MSYLFSAALAGNPNSGKSTVFNTLTGSRQHVGNYPGITVDKKDGVAKLHGKSVHIIDLPGVYSLTAYSPEELVARKVLAEERPNVVINVIDAGSLSRNLYFTVQLMEMGAPIVLILNMMDELPARGISINIKRLSELLNAPAVGAVAREGKGLQNALELAEKRAKESSGKDWTPLEISYGADLDPVLVQMANLIKDNKFLTSFAPSWVALKYMESDDEIMKLGKAADPALAAQLESLVKRVAEHLKATLDTYPEAVIADYRYGFISSILRQGVISQKDELARRVSASDKIDSIVTNVFFGPIIMLLSIFMIYKITFTLGEAPMGLLESFFGFCADVLKNNMADGDLRSLLVDGVIAGVGGVMGFVPLIMIIFVLIAVLEDSGYMARMAYMLDKIFRTFGLHGSSVMPFIISGGIAGGCAVPGIMATRTLRSRKEKLATILTTPFFSCGAKLPVFLLLCKIFFPQNPDLAMFLITTILAWVLTLLVALFLRKTVLRGEATPFVMELPPYRFPTFKGVLMHMWERTWAYIRKAGTIILAVSIIMWAMLTYPKLPENAGEAFAQQRTAIEQKITDAEKANSPLAPLKNELKGKLDQIAASESAATLDHTYAGRLGHLIEPVSELAGFNWRMNIALIGGLAAKEVVVSTLGTVYSLSSVTPEETNNLEASIKADKNWNLAVGVSFIIFVLIYAPCAATIAVIKQESSSFKWAAFSYTFNTTLALALSTGVYQVLIRLI